VSTGAAAAVNLFDRVIGNDGDCEAEAVAHETPVLLPPRSRFLMSDVTRLRPLLPGVAAHTCRQTCHSARCHYSCCDQPFPHYNFIPTSCCTSPRRLQVQCFHHMQVCRCICVVSAAGGPEERYDLVVLDPPWENASARRASHYPTLPSRNLLAIPMRRLLRPVRCGCTVSSDPLEC
jgi:hypothetical protein